MREVFSLRFLDKMGQRKAGTYSVDLFVGVLEAVVGCAVGVQAFTSEATTYHSPEEVRVDGVEFVQLLLRERPVLARVCEARPDEAIEKLHSGFDGDRVIGE